MPCASINWQLVKRAEALLVPHAYAQLCGIRITFLITNDNYECIIDCCVLLRSGEVHNVLV